jgi:hypothetical protein
LLTISPELLAQLAVTMHNAQALNADSAKVLVYLLLLTETGFGLPDQDLHGY